MYEIKKIKTAIEMVYNEPKILLNPLQDLYSGFQQMSFKKTKEGLQSSNFKTGTAGWNMTNTGNVEFNTGTFRGALEANSINIPDTTSANSFHVDNTGNAWWGATTIGNSVAKILNTGIATFGNATDYFKWDGTNIQILSSSVNAITVAHGSNILLKEGGDINFTSVTSPIACTVALITATGNIDAGTHTYKITYVNSSGETELGTASNTVTNDASNAQNALTGIPVSTSGSVISRKIYRTKAGGTNYYLLATIVDNTTTTYTDNTADASLTGNNANYLLNNSYGKIKINGMRVMDTSDTTILGLFAGYNSTGYRNTFIGYYSGSNNKGFANTFVGQLSGYSNTIGQYNTFIGGNSGDNNTTGNSNTFVGQSSGQQNISGNSNTFVGQTSGLTTTGDNNTFVGSGAGASTTSCNNNTFLGYTSGDYITTGSTNICIGITSGLFNSTGSNNIYIGGTTQTLVDGSTNEIVIGDTAIGAGSNSVTLGNTSITKTILRGDVTTSTIKTSGYTVATLPTGTVGMRAYVTDATTPTYLGALTGGGAVTCPVFFDGTSWLSA